MGDEQEKISKRTKILIIAAVLVFTFIWVYRPHLDYKYPLHVDEWASLNEARRISETGSVYDKQEIGFFAFLAALDKITNLIEIYRFLPALFACLSSLALFFLVSRKTNFYTGIFAMLFFGALPSNINILGIQFFVAMTFAMPFLFLFALFFTEGFEEGNNKKIIAAVIFAAIISFIHPPTVMLIFAVSAAYLLVNFNRTKKFAKLIIKKNPWILVLPIVIIFWVFYFLWDGSLTSTLGNIFSKLKFEIGYAPYQVNYFFPCLYGWIASAIATLGIAKGLKKKKFLFFNVWIAVAFALLLFFIFFKFSILASYQRVIYFALLGIVPFSAIGMSYVLYKSKKHIKPFILASLIIFTIFYFHYEPNEDLKPFYLIDDKDYETILFLSSLNKSVAMAPLQESLAVYYLSGHGTLLRKYFISLNSSIAAETIAFYSNNVNCTEKKRILEKHDARYVWSKNKIECGFSQIFYNGNYVYEFDKFIHGTLPHECGFAGQLVNCTTEDGGLGVQRCRDYKGWGKVLGECILYECDYAGQLVNCTTEDGKPGFRRCVDYKGHGKVLLGCWPSECYDYQGNFLNCTKD